MSVNTTYSLITYESSQAYSLLSALPGAYFQDVNGTIEFAPKSIPTVAGERILLPIINMIQSIWNFQFLASAKAEPSKPTTICYQGECKSEHSYHIEHILDKTKRDRRHFLQLIVCSFELEIDNVRCTMPVQLAKNEFAVFRNEALAFLETMRNFSHAIRITEPQDNTPVYDFEDNQRANRSILHFLRLAQVYKSEKGSDQDIVELYDMLVSFDFARAVSSALENRIFAGLFELLFASAGEKGDLVEALECDPNIELQLYLTAALKTDNSVTRKLFRLGRLREEFFKGNMSVDLLYERVRLLAI